MFSERIGELRRIIEEKTVKQDLNILLKKCTDIYSTIYQQAEAARKSEDKYERSLAWIIYVFGQERLPSTNEEKYEFFKRFVEEVNTIKKTLGAKDEVSYRRKP